MSHLSRLVGPGILRLYLAAFVVAQHLGLIGLGATAVYLFFVLSGFWITALWQERYSHSPHPYLTFLLSRYWRLFPLYFVCVSLMGGAWAHWSPGFFKAFLNTDFSAAWVIRNFLIASSASQPAFLCTTWSLDIEMQFYLVAPVLLWILGALAQRGKALLLGAALLASGLSVGLILGKSPQTTLLPAYLGFFVLGSLLHHGKWKTSPRLAWAGLIGFVVFTAVLLAIPATRPYLDERWAQRQAATLFYHLAYSLVAVALLLAPTAFCLGRPSDSLDRQLGDLAYPVYIFHMIPIEVLCRIARLQNLGKPAHIAINLALVTLGSLALFYAVDRPMEKLRRRFINSRCRKPSGIAPGLASNSHLSQSGAGPKLPE